MSKNNYSTRQIMQLMQIALTNNLTQVRMILAIGMPDTRGNAWLDMNGRVYDPSIGRFLSADPHIQAPYNTQSYNRYSYVLNNPLKYTDPSGYFFKWLARKIKKYARVIVAVAVSYFSAGTLSGWAASWGFTAGTIANGAVTGSILGFTSGAIVTGNLKGAINGAITGGIMGGIAGNYGKTWNANRVGANAVGGGIASEVTGGRFKDGFKMAGLTSGMRYVYGEISSQYNKTGKPHLWQKGENNVGMQLNETNLQKISRGEIIAPWYSDQSNLMKTIGKYVPFADAFGEFHDGFHNLPYIPEDQLSLIVTMPYSYAFTTVAYAQPYTHFYITDRNNKKEKNR